MWILPKSIISAFAPGTEALISGSDEFSRVAEQSLMWRSKPSQSRTWSQRWRKGGWIQLLSGRILKTSTGTHFAERLTSSLEAFHVNLSPQQEVEKSIVIPDTCGHTSQEESGLSDLPLFSWKTSKVSSAQNSKEITGTTPQEHQWLSMSSENWKDWVIKQRAAYSQRKRQALLIKENASFFWRSPTTSQIKDHCSEESQTRQEDTEIGGLREEEKHSSTGNPPAPYLEKTETTAEQGARCRPPRSAMSKAPRGGGHGEIVQYRIENQVQEKRLRWATPRADIKRPQGGGTDKKAQSKIENQVQAPPAENQVQTPHQELNHRNSTTSTSWKTPTVAEGGKIANQINQGQLGLSNDPLLERGKKDKSENYRGYLNPRWVETLMGVPVGWCDPLWNQDPCSCTNRYDELRLLGNGVVPATAEVAIRTLLTRLLGDET